MMPTRTKSAFSLVELSIVLVILGLLVGGILAGQSLIRASEMRAISTEYLRYSTMMHTFRDKYFSLPGDMNNATSFWGGADATPSVYATCIAINTASLPANTGAATCDGNGDNKIQQASGHYSEVFRFWQHASNAGLIEGSYTGYTNSTSATIVLSGGTNVPISKAKPYVWLLQYVGSIASGHGTYYADNYDNALFFGRQAVSGPPDGTALKPEEAWNIDTKLDDGKPGYGIVKTLISRPNCTTTVVQSTAQYALTTTTIECPLLFKSGL